ncbi:hypothetical protein [Thermomonospora amylolytica]|uniref:hypothetical protein n=1 Tax=Thermomonospora amylolytica TaxID=1411117 RepID=UPI000E6CF99C|nr:hypothetical protein [Thermomonospora amylolytica]
MDVWSVVRWARAAGFSAGCVLLAAAGHVFGGGRVDDAALAAGFVLLFVPALALTGRERTMGTILPAVAASQVLMHALLPEDQARAGVAAAGYAEHAGHAALPGLDMLLMHVVAVLATAWWLECGEAALCALVRHLAGWALRPLRPVRVPPADELRAPVVVHREEHGLRLAVLRHVVGRRGPPVGQVALG